MSADPDEVAAAIEKLKNDDQLTEELAEANAEKEEALKEVERLKAELAKSDADKEKQQQYNQAVSDLEASDSFEQGTALTVSGNYEEAASAYNRAIVLRPDNAKAYFNRSIVYINMGDYSRAEADIDRAMVLRPANTSGYYRRAVVYGNIRQARMVKQKQQQGLTQDDSLQRFLEKKRIKNNLAKISAQERRPFVRESNKRSSALPPRLENKQQPLPGQRQAVPRPGINRPLAKPGPQPPQKLNLKAAGKKNQKNKLREGRDEESGNHKRLPVR